MLPRMLERLNSASEELRDLTLKAEDLINLMIGGDDKMPPNKPGGLVTGMPPNLVGAIELLTDRVGSLRYQIYRLQDRDAPESPQTRLR